jgi:hypothetical protein
MAKTPRPEAIRYIPLAARKEVVVNDELKTLSINALFNGAYRHAFQIPENRQVLQN